MRGAPLLVGCAVAALSLIAPTVRAQPVRKPAAKRARPRLVDRVVVRFTSPETGGARSPQFVYERMLAFQARLEAAADPDRLGGKRRPYRARHVRAALERHIAETMLASLKVTRPYGKRILERRTQAARLALLQRVGGLQALQRAARAEGVGDSDVLRLLRRQARASLYVDQMITPMLKPSDAELKVLFRTGRTPFRTKDFAEAKQPLRRWYVGIKLRGALATYYQNARSRMEIKIVR